MIRAFLLLGCLLLLASCGSSITRTFSLEPLGGVTLDSSSQYPGGISPVVIDAPGASIVTVGQDLDGLLRVAQFDSTLTQRWKLDVGLGADNWIESSGLHVSGGALFIPVLILHEEGVTEYAAHSVSVSTGESTVPMTLMRLNQNDVGELPTTFAHDVAYTGRRSVRPIWSPDSSKLLLFKQYFAGNGRVTIEMMLYKRGFTLITKNNVDFRLDTNTQRVIGIQVDNDGVAYIFLHDLREPAIEVGRFEILGSKKLRTLKARLPENATGSIAVAPRGHAYVAAYSSGSKPTLDLIDLDFYRDSAIVRTNPVASAGADRRQAPPAILAIPKADRVVLTLDQYIDRKTVTNWLIAYDLEGNKIWDTKDPKPLVLAGRHTLAPETVLLGHSLGYCWPNDKALSMTKIDLATGAAQQMDVAKVSEGSVPFLNVSASGKQLRFYNDRLYRLSLP